MYFLFPLHWEDISYPRVESSRILAMGNYLNLYSAPNLLPHARTALDLPIAATLNPQLRKKKSLFSPTTVSFPGDVWFCFCVLFFCKQKWNDNVNPASSRNFSSSRTTSTEQHFILSKSLRKLITNLSVLSIKMYSFEALLVKMWIGMRLRSVSPLQITVCHKDKIFFPLS